MDKSGTAEDSIFKIAKVISVDGRIIRVKVDKTKNTSHLVYKGRLLKNISVGGFIKIAKGFTSIIGKVDGEFIVEDKQYGKQEYKSDREKVSRTLTVSLLGFFQGKNFIRGIKEMPLIDNECFLLRAEEFSQVHNFLTAGDQPLTLGSLALEHGHDIAVGINSLFASHISIFGNTGSGKSYTLARLYKELFAQFKTKPNFVAKADFLLIDFNGEYVQDGDADDIIVEHQYKNIYKLSTKDQNGSKLPLTLETLNDVEFWTVFLEATEKTQRPFLRRAIENNFLQARVENEALLKAYLASLVFTVTASNDRNLEKGVILNLLEQVEHCVHGNASLQTLHEDYRANLQFNGTTRQWYYGEGAHRIFGNTEEFQQQAIETKFDALTIPLANLSEIDQIRLRVTLHYYDDIIKGFSNREHLAPLMKRMDNRIEDLKKVVAIQEESQEQVERKNLTIVSLKNANVHIRKIVPLLLCKRMYEEKKRQNDSTAYLNLIIDEPCPFGRHA